MHTVTGRIRRVDEVLIDPAVVKVKKPLIALEQISDQIGFEDFCETRVDDWKQGIETIDSSFNKWSSIEI